MRSRWTAEKDALLRDLYPEFGAPETARRLDATLAAVRTRVGVLGLVRNRRRPRLWTPARDAVLRDVYSRDGLDAAAAAVGLSRSAVKNRVSQLGLRRPSRAWTAEEDRVVVEDYADGLTAPVIAAKLGRGVPAVHRRSRILGVMSGRNFETAAVERVRAAYPVIGAAALARELLGDDSPVSVYRMYRLAERLGVTVPVRHPEWVYDRVRALHAQGMNDRQIAAAMAEYFPGRSDRERVTAIRRRMGLPAIKQTPEQMRELGRRTRAMQTAAGVNPRDLAFRRVAESYGLPADTPPRAVQILLALAGGPKTRAELEDAGCKPTLLWNKLGTGYAAGLVRRGLVATAPLPGATNRGPRMVYFLTAAAMDLLASTNEKETA